MNTNIRMHTQNTINLLLPSYQRNLYSSELKWTISRTKGKIIIIVVW